MSGKRVPTLGVRQVPLKNFVLSLPGSAKSIDDRWKALDFLNSAMIQKLLKKAWVRQEFAILNGGKDDGPSV